MKTLLILCASIALINPAAEAQQRSSVDVSESFEVASVKPVGPVPSGGGRGSDAAGGMGSGCDGGFPKLEGDRFNVTTTAYALITWAYGYNKVWGCSFVSFGDLLLGGPGWIRSERFEIQALMPEGSPTYTLNQFMKGDAPQLEKMLQALLRDRFNLAVHRQSREVPAYALLPGKGGPKLKPAQSEDRRGMGVRRAAETNGQILTTIVGRKVEMRDFAFMLLLNTHRPVIDRTGLTGEFSFDLSFAPFDSEAPGDSGGPSIFFKSSSGSKWKTPKPRSMPS